MRLKQATSALLRKTNLLSAANEVARLSKLALEYKANREFSRQHPDFVLPPTTMLFEIFNRVNYQQYYEGGRLSAQSIIKLLERYMDLNGAAICEWGCGVARVIRHFPELLTGKNATVFATDYNEKMIEWCEANIKNVQFKRNQLYPPLEFATETFDAIYCTSVFTHLSAESQKRWLLELMRLLCKNGVLLLTVHGDFYAKSKLTALELEKYMSGDIVIRDNVAEGSKFFGAFQGEKYMKEVLLREQKILAHVCEPALQIAGSQDIWLIQKT